MHANRVQMNKEVQAVATAFVVMIIWFCAEMHKRLKKNKLVQAVALPF